MTPAPTPLPALLRRRAVAHLRAADPTLADLMDEVGPCRWQVHRAISPFAALTSAIVYQQISGKAAAAILARVVALGGKGRLRPAHVLAASDEALRACGLSRQKAAYLRDLAGHAVRGNGLSGLARLEDEAVIERLTAVRGVGRWTAEMYLMFRLGRPDVLPVDDYGIRKAMQRAYRMRALPRPDRMRLIAERWRPYRTVACWYLWRSLGGDAGA
jgi:3-methyladenine DNA glycosylase/8-oxoguanine DNA glycosylase